MPKHSHDIVYGNKDATSGVTISYSGSGKSVLNVESWQWRNNGSGNGNNIYAKTTGGDQAHDNMPPFQTIYYWRRTA